MPSGSRGAELRLDLQADGSDLVRAFVREASLAEGASLPAAGHIADGAVILWRKLCQHHGLEGRARLSAAARGGEIVVRAFVKGHDKFARLMPSLFVGLPADLGFAYRESGIDGWEVTLRAGREPFIPALHDVHEGEDESGPAETFVIEPPREEDSPGIARCFLQVYGHHYVHTEVFSPRRYWAKVREGAIIPVIARNSAGEIVGHVALEREAGAQIAERGQAVVLPSYRGQHLLERMSERLTQEAERIGLVGIFAQPVTIHTFSQRNDDRAGMPVCAAMLGMLPENVLPKDLSVPTRGQRQSLLLAFRFLQAPGERLYYAPEAYRETISGIGASLGMQPRFSDRFDCAVKMSSLHVNLDKNGFADIRVEQIGAGIDGELRLTFANLTSLGAEYVLLAAPLADPGLSLLVGAARHLGFYFCGIGPAFLSSGDALLLQFTLHPLDASKLQLFTDGARALLAFIEEDRAHGPKGIARGQ